MDKYEPFCAEKCTERLGWNPHKRAKCRESTPCPQFSAELRSDTEILVSLLETVALAYEVAYMTPDDGTQKAAQDRVVSKRILRMVVGKLLH